MNVERHMAEQLVELGLEVDVIVKVIMKLCASPLALAYIQRGKIVDSLHVVGVELVVEPPPEYDNFGSIFEGPYDRP